MTIFTWTGIKITGYNLTIFKQNGRLMRKDIYNI